MVLPCPKKSNIRVILEFFNHARVVAYYSGFFSGGYYASLFGYYPSGKCGYFTDGF